ncbi:MAG: multidrug efflux SMR transporter [Bauldia sp.]
MAWIVLLLAGLLEVAFAFALKQSAGFSKPIPSVLAVAGVAASLALLGVALKSLPLATAYAVWTGIGTVGTVLVGFAIGETVTALKLASIALIVAGIVGLKLA